MAKIAIKSASTAFVANLANTTYVLGAKQALDVDDSQAIDARLDTAGRAFELYGDIQSTGYGIQVGAIGAASAPAFVHVGQSGSISAQYSTIVMRGAGHSVFNQGSLTSTDTSSVIYGDGDFFSLTNSGVISGVSTGVQFGGDGGLLVNRGTINAATAVVNQSDTGATSRLVNHGTIHGAQAAINSGGGDDTLVNTGTITGTVYLGYGDDIFRNRGGEVAGTVQGGLGNDLYIVDRTDLIVEEGLNWGFDTVKSSVDWVLDVNFEMLVLTGKADRSATGNTLNNFINGNRGDNVISGDAGQDYMSGKGGNDILTGGSEADTFHFVLNGGTDRITDFQNGIDKINISAWTEIVGFADLLAHHISVRNGDDLLIQAGDDRIIIENTSLDTLSDASFIF